MVQAEALNVAQFISCKVRLYGCARVSDGQRACLEGMPDLPDPSLGGGSNGFLELEVIGSKTAYTFKKKTVCPTCRRTPLQPV